MKTLIFFVLSLSLYSCNGHNTSGSPSAETNSLSAVSPLSSVSVEGSELVSDYKKKCIEIVQNYRDDLVRDFGTERLLLIRARIRSMDVSLSRQVITENGDPVSSTVVNSGVVLYVGDEIPQLNWYQVIRQRSDLTSTIMHSILTLSDIDDQDYRYSRTLLRRGSRPHEH